MKLLFYPRGPQKKNKIKQICNYLNLGITNDPQDEFDIAINWRGAAWHPRWPELDVISQAGIRVINHFCTNVKKDYVDEAFKAEFGYSSLVDPLSYNGHAVQKSNRQAAHDGRIIELPISKPKPDHVYQRLINNKVEEDTYRDIRVVIFNDKVPMVFFKNKDVSIRFSGQSSSAHVIWPSEFDYFFGPDLIPGVVRFCKRIGMDYGEVDVLYCRDSRRYYIIDANKTTGNGVFTMFTHKVRNKVIEVMAETFKKEFL